MDKYILQLTFTERGSYGSVFAWRFSPEIREQIHITGSADIWDRIYASEYIIENYVVNKTIVGKGFCHLAYKYVMNGYKPAVFKEIVKILEKTGLENICISHIFENDTPISITFGFYGYGYFPWARFPMELSELQNIDPEKYGFRKYKNGSVHNYTLQTKSAENRIDENIKRKLKIAPATIRPETYLISPSQELSPKYTIPSLLHVPLSQLHMK